jgi:putative ABC transport system substrate-binding protein
MAERLEIAKDVVPRVARVAVLVNPANAGAGPTTLKMEAAARSLNLELQRFDLRRPEQIESTVASIKKARSGAVVVQDDTLFSVHARALADQALKHQLPMVGGHSLAQAGGLIGYGRDELSLYRRSANYVDRILKGTPAGELPIEQATRFELWLNSKTVLALGIQLPEVIRIRVDKLVQ